MPIQNVLIPKIRCLTCDGAPWITPDENQSPEDAGLDHLVLHKDDPGGRHELGVRYILAEIEVEEMAAKAPEGEPELAEEQLES